MNWTNEDTRGLHVAVWVLCSVIVGTSVAAALVLFW